MLRSAFTLAAGFCLAMTLLGPAAAQNGLPGPIIPPLPGGTMDCLPVDGDDVVTALGSDFTVALNLDGMDVVTVLSLFIQNDSTQIILNGWTEGSAVQGYLADHGPIPCDVAQTPDGIFLTMFFPMPFDPAVYGRQMAQLHYSVTTATPGSTEILLLQASCTNTTDGVIQISIQDDVPPALMRGDINADGACNLVDAVKVLSHVFGGEFIECQDAADLNDDGNLSLADPVLLLQSIFGSGPALSEACETDGTADGLGCAQSNCP